MTAWCSRSATCLKPPEYFDVVFIDEVPKTSVGKFSKKTLREKYADHLLSKLSDAGYVANVVAVLVVAEVEVVSAVAAPGSAVLPLQLPVEPADDVPLEPPEDPIGRQRGFRAWACSLGGSVEP